MGAVDDVLRTVGEPVTIERNGGNVSTYFYFSPKDVRWPLEISAMMPTDCGVTGGDIIKHRSGYYIVVDFFEDRRVNEFFYYKVKLYKCNAVVSVRAQNATSKQFEDIKTGVHCLITSGSGEAPEDKANVISRYAGKDMLFACFMQSSVSISKNNFLASGNRVYRVTDEIDPHFADGVTRVFLKIEKYA